MNVAQTEARRWFRQARRTWKLSAPYVWPDTTPPLASIASRQRRRRLKRCFIARVVGQFWAQCAQPPTWVELYAMASMLHEFYNSHQTFCTAKFVLK